MNILFLSTHLNAGGITSYVHTMASGLRRRGHHVHVATSGGNMEEEFASLGVKLLRLNICTKSELDPRIYCALFTLVKYIRQNNIDLIHAQTRITQVMGACLNMITGKPYLSTCHGFFKRRLSRRWMPCWGNAVIAISKPVKKHLASDFKVKARRIFLIESGIDLDEFALIDNETRKVHRRRHHLGDKPAVGMIARLSDVKGQDVLIEALNKVITHFRDIKLILVGEGKMEKELRDIVKRLNLQDHVWFFPIVNRTYEMLSLFDIFVMPSRQEGLGLSIMEAQAAGLPVIASRVGGIPTLIEDGKTGILVKPGDWNELAEAIIRLLQDRARMNKIGLAGREFIKKNFSADRMLNEVEDLYRRLVSNKS